MNPFELTKDQYGSITVRIKSECVVLTREEARRIEERFIGISGENVKLRELVDGLTWCCEHYSCRQECPLYDVSEPDHCREISIKRELGIEVEQ